MGIREQILQMTREEAAERKELENKTAFVRNLLQENVFAVEKIASLSSCFNR